MYNALNRSCRTFECPPPGILIMNQPSPSAPETRNGQPASLQKSIRLTASLDRREYVNRTDQLLNLILVLVPFAATVFAVAGTIFWTTNLISWKDMAIMAGFYIPAGIGVTVGYHRMLTHTGFQASPLLRAVLLIFGVWSIQGSPISWAAIHLKHHAYSDTDQDPHSPVRSFYYAHMGWLFSGFRVDPSSYAKAQLNDPVARFVSRTAFWWALLGLLLPLAIGGWTGLLWGTGVRVFLLHHVTWAVNSVCHTFGSRPFRTGEDQSTNNAIIGLLGLGEGWHNNHHAFPRSVYHGLRRWEIDVSGYLISMMERLRLIRDPYKVPKHVVAERRTRGAAAILQPVQVGAAAGSPRPSPPVTDGGEATLEEPPVVVTTPRRPTP